MKRLIKKVLIPLLTLGVLGSPLSVYSCDIFTSPSEEKAIFSDMDKGDTRQTETGFSDGESFSEYTTEVNETTSVSEAYQAGIENFVFQIDGILESVTITKYTGEFAEVVIPTEIEGYPVTKISSNIFSENNSVQSLVISENVKEIGEGAFWYLPNLEKVTIRSQQPSIQGLDFQMCNSLRMVEISGKLEILNGYIFRGCSSLVKVILPDSLKIIGKGAFGYSGIESFSIPDTVEEMGDNVFEECKNLKEVRWNKKLKSVPNATFKGDSSLRKVVLYEGLEVIGESAFSESGIETVILPNTLKIIDCYAFYRSQLKEIDIPESVEAMGRQALGCNPNTLVKLIIRGNPIIPIDNIFANGYGYNITPKVIFALENSVLTYNYNIFPINPPQNLNISAPNDSTAVLAWTPLNEIAEYKIYRSTSENGKFEEIGTTFNSFWKDETLDKTVCYYYRICPYYKDRDVLGNMSSTLKWQMSSLNDCTVEPINKQWYSGTEIRPLVIVKYKEVQLVDGTDYTVTYSNNIEVGTAKIIITGKRIHYYGTKEISFRIERRNIKDLNFSSVKTVYSYTGKAITPKVTVKNNGKSLKTGTDYTIQYKNNVNLGKASIVIEGKGKYTGTKTIYFSIGPQKPVIVSLTALDKERIKIQWKKSKNVQGYVLYRADLNGEFRKIKTIKNANVTKYTDTGLNSGTKYRYKIRSYKKVNGKNIYSPYSAVKSKATKSLVISTGTYYQRPDSRTEVSVKIYKRGSLYYAEISRSHSFDVTTICLYNYGSYYYGKEGYDGMGITVTPYSSNKIYVRFENYMTAFTGYFSSDKNLSYNVKVTAPDGGANMRSGAGVEYNKVLYNMIPNGTILRVNKEAIASNGNYWGYTKYNNVYGWIALTQVTRM